MPLSVLAQERAYDPEPGRRDTRTEVQDFCRFAAEVNEFWPVSQAPTAALTRDSPRCGCFRN